jgi:selenocysteine lyase/cysteine desulfurase
MPAPADLLIRTAALAIEYLDGVDERPVGRPTDTAGLRAALGGPDGGLPAQGVEAAAVIEELAAAADPGLVASAGPRYFGFVVGGSLPAALAADWLTSAWDQNSFSYVSSPAASVIEETAARWALEVLGLPQTASAGFPTGATTANVVGLAAARHAVLARAGWDVEAQGLIGAPPIRILVGEEIHASALAALRLVGLGMGTLERLPVDGQGAVQAEAAERALSGATGPVIVVLQAGNVNSGAFDPVGPIATAAHAVGGWVHVDGAFGLWAGASPRTRPLLAGIETADSWATDCHKWLNVPYDCGFVAVTDRAAHYEAMRMSAAYLVPAPDRELDAFDWVPEASRRGRATPVYAALRQLGRDGLARRPMLHPRPPDGRPALRRARSHDPQRRRRQPGPGSLRQPGSRGRRGSRPRSRRENPRRHRGRSGRRDVLGRWDHVARHGRHAYLGVRLEHHRGGHRSGRRRHPALRACNALTASCARFDRARHT